LSGVKAPLCFSIWRADERMHLELVVKVQYSWGEMGVAELV